MTVADAVRSGVAGAGTVTLVHQAARARLKDAPRVDIVGMRALRKLWRAAGRRVPRGRKLYRQTFAAELLSNGLYYALASFGDRRRALWRGTALGAAAGAGAVFLPPVLKLGRRPVRRRARTAWETFSWYLLGGIAAGAARRFA